MIASSDSVVNSVNRITKFKYRQEMKFAERNCFSCKSSKVEMGTRYRIMPSNKRLKEINRPRIAMGLILNYHSWFFFQTELLPKESFKIY